MPITLAALAIGLGLVACGDKDGSGADGGSGDGGSVGTDNDGDGFTTADDCDDSNPAISPAATEICDGVDNNCNDLVDEGLTTAFFVDADLDGWGDGSSRAEACEWREGLSVSGEDCDDGDPLVNPGMEELCNGVDDDCNEEIDEPSARDAVTWYLDGDGDGYGDAEKVTVACTQPALHVVSPGDCDDANAAVHPAAAEVCNGIDDNCDGTTDTDAVDPTTWYKDRDGDGYGEIGGGTISSCTQPTGFVSVSGDCQDTIPEINPGAAEVCDGVENDCDAATTERNRVTWQASDGSLSDVSSYFTSGTWSAPAGWVLSGGGTYRFCPGTYYTYLSFNSDTNLWGVGDAADIVLSAAEYASVVTVERTGVDLDIRNLTLADGVGSGTFGGSTAYRTGGGVACLARGTVTLRDSVLQDHTAAVGGALYLENCTASLSNVEITNSAADYGGGIAIVSGGLTMSSTTLEGNSATWSGGGLYLDGSATSALSVTMADSLFQSNSATYGGGLALFEAAFSCTSTGGTHGFLSNSADYGGAVFISDPTSFRSTSCDWGSGRTDNRPHDVYLDSSGNTYGYGDDSSFTCGGYYCAD